MIRYLVPLFVALSCQLEPAPTQPDAFSCDGHVVVSGLLARACTVTVDGAAQPVTECGYLSPDQWLVKLVGGSETRPTVISAHRTDSQWAGDYAGQAMTCEPVVP